MRVSDYAILIAAVTNAQRIRHVGGIRPSRAVDRGNSRQARLRFFSPRVKKNRLSYTANTALLALQLYPAYHCITQWQ